MSNMKSGAWSLLLVALIAASCDTQSQPQSGASPRSWLHRSNPVDTQVLQTLPEPDHCGGASTFLVIGWPLGHAEPNLNNSRWYVRNPEVHMEGLLLREFAVDVTPPQDAQDTGYYNARFQLWLAPSDQDVVAHVKTAGGFERWPRAMQAMFCQ